MKFLYRRHQNFFCSEKTKQIQFHMQQAVLQLPAISLRSPITELTRNGLLFHSPRGFLSFPPPNFAELPSLPPTSQIHDVNLPSPLRKRSYRRPLEGVPEMVSKQLPVLYMQSSTATVRPPPCARRGKPSRKDFQRIDRDTRIEGPRKKELMEALYLTLSGSHRAELMVWSK